MKVQYIIERRRREASITYCTLYFFIQNYTHGKISMNKYGLNRNASLMNNKMTTVL